MILLLFAVFVAAQGNNNIYLITLNYKKIVTSQGIAIADSLSLVSIIKTQGIVSAEGVGTYRLEIVSNNNQVLSSIKFNPPETQSSNKVGKVGISNTDFTISVPFFENGKLINIYNSHDKKVLEIPVDAFQESKQSKQQLLLLMPKGITKETEAIKVPAEETILKISFSWWYIAAPVLLIIVFLAYLEVKRTKDHAELMRHMKQQNTLALKNYVMTNLRKGYNKEQIRNALIKNNYNKEEIEESFRGLR